ncbi:MAG: nucleotidyl transferase AbiEii/AbiGii toxin family protein [Treponematales bacterium]
MISPREYYEESLYPLQDGILNIISQSGTGFFLTGGTALSRAYYNHRYSDDLDFFVNNVSDFDEQIDTALDALKAGGFFWNETNSFIRNKNFLSLKVGWDKSEVLLKLDFVNDLVPHFGGIISTPLFSRVDSLRNIVSNKLSALFRFEAKDATDIREIALHERVDWGQVICEAREKDAGIELPIITEILSGVPESEFEKIVWVEKPSWQVFRGDIARITQDMLLAGV